MAEITIIVPVYKVENYLCRCVDSILSQTFKDYELILVDDGSPDHCGEICDEYAEKDDRIYVIHQGNKGLSAARNTGIEWALQYSNSTWLSFVDSDDWIHPLYLELLLSAALENKTNIAIGGFELTCGDPLPNIDKNQLNVRLKATDNFYMESNVNATVAWGKLYRKSCFATLRFPIGRIHEDEFITYKILFQYEYVVVVDHPIYAYFQNKQGIMNSPWSYKRLDALDALEGQLHFFLQINRKDIAGFAFRRLISNIEINRNKIDDCISLTDKERTMLIKALKKKTRCLLIRYRKYGWMSFRRNGLSRRVYMDVFPGVRQARATWLVLKKILKK